MNLHLDGKTALVTGSTAGIGYAIAQGLAREGAHVFVNGRAQRSVDKAVAGMKAHTPNARIEGVAADVSTKEGCQAIIHQLATVDILVNNAGIFEPVPFEKITDEDWSRFFETNVLSGVRLSRHYLHGMRKKDWGRILFISSESGINIPVEMIHYGMTKSAVIAIARGLAESVAGTGVTVNSILPGPTASAGVDQMLETQAKEKGTSKEEAEKNFFKHDRPSSLLQRFATPEEVANLAVYVASELSVATNGAPLRVDGGVVRSAF
ncbi:MAG: SDR family NAD(P)-dependent oxidoreductase [Acidobacteriaceae bacterium]